MREPIADPYLGKIQYFKEDDLYEGSFYIKEFQTARFSFDVNDNLEEMLQLTRNIVEKAKNSDLQFRLHVAKHLLDSYNDDWSESEVIDREEFASRISLDSIMIYDDNSAEIYYRDADLFAGHYIIIYLNSEGELGEPYLAG